MENINLELKINEQVAKIEKQFQQLKQEKESLVKEKAKWWKNIWTIIVSFGSRNRKNEIQEQINKLEESIKNEKFAVDLLKKLLETIIANFTNNLETKLKIENLTNENNKLKAELTNAKAKENSLKDLLEKTKFELLNKLTKADSADEINLSLKDTVLSIVSDEKNIGVLTSVGNMLMDYFLKPKKETSSKKECPLQVNYYNFNYDILNCRYVGNPFLIWTIKNSKSIISDKNMKNYNNFESVLTKKPIIKFNHWWIVGGVLGVGASFSYLFYRFFSKKSQKQNIEIKKQNEGSTKVKNAEINLTPKSAIIWSKEHANAINNDGNNNWCKTRIVIPSAKI